MITGRSTLLRWKCSGRKGGSIRPELSAGVEPILLNDLGRNDEARAVMERVVQQYGERMTEPERIWTKRFFERLN